jgi:hypothetical protein
MNNIFNQLQINYFTQITLLACVLTVRYAGNVDSYLPTFRVNRSLQNCKGQALQEELQTTQKSEGLNKMATVARHLLTFSYV